MPFLHAGEVATLFSRSTKWVYQHQDEIPGKVRVAGSIFWDEEVLLKALKEQASRPSPGVNRHGL